MKRIIIWGLAICFSVLNPLGPIEAAGLSTPFVDVRVENVPLGVPYVVTHSSADGVLLTNLESEPLNVRIEPFQPAAADLRGDASAIPDVSWVQITPAHATIGPHARLLCRVTIKVPKNKAFSGKTYQVMIWSRGDLPQQRGVGLSAGLISRLRFKTL